MISSRELIDVEISRLLKEWEPRIGAPTCGPGCSRCCERMTVVVSSAEALRLVDGAPEFAAKVDRAVMRLPAGAGLNDLLDMGPCIFLGAGKCQVYESRPDACRACNVWHDSRYCGREYFDMCTPAELNSLRLRHLHERMIGEFAAGRLPFRGYLLPAVWLMQERRKQYLAGDDLSVGLDQRWIDGDLLEFPTLDELTTEKADLDAIFAIEENPMGFPRASRVKDRAMLEAFDLRV